MVVTEKKQQSSSAAAADDDWDVVNPTVARMKPDGSSTEGDDCDSIPKDRTSFIFVNRDGVSQPVLVSTPPVSTPVPPPAAVATATDRRSPPVPPAGGPVLPGSVLVALQKMADAPQLPGTPPFVPQPSPPPPPASVYLPPPPSVATSTGLPPPTVAPHAPRTLRDLQTLSQEEQLARQVVSREVEVEHRRLANENRLAWQQETEAVALRLQAEERALHLRSQEEERLTREALGRLLVEQNERAKAGPAPRATAAAASSTSAGTRGCECLGATAGIHRPSCPRATAV